MTNRTPPARCWHTAFDEIECTIPFGRDPALSRNLIDAWKARIPYARRNFDGTSKVWRFWGGYQDDAIEELLERFPDAECPRRSRRQARPPANSGGSHFRVLHLRETAPPELVDAAFRCLAKMHHPDKGGDPGTMRELTAARDALSRRLSA